MVDVKGLPAVIISTRLTAADRREKRDDIFEKITERPFVGRLYESGFAEMLEKATLTKNAESLYLYQIKYLFPEAYGSPNWVERTLRTFVMLCNIKNLEPHEGESREEIEELKVSFNETGIVVTPIMAMMQGIQHLIERLYNKLKPEDEETEMTIPLYHEAFAEDTPEPRGSTHTIWRVKDPKWIEHVQHSLRKKKFAIITDGHHRYRALKEELKCKWIPVAFADIDDRDLVLMSWHRLIKRIDRDQIAETAKRVMSREFMHTHSAMLFKLNSIEDIRVATHPAESIELEVRRRVLPEYVSFYPRKVRLPEDEEIDIEDQIPDEIKEKWPRYDILNAPFPKGAKLLADRPFIEKIVEFPEEELKVKVHEKGIYWEREVFKDHFQRMVAFGLYLVHKPKIIGGPKEEKFYLLTSGQNITVFTTALDNMIKEVVGERDFKKKVKYVSEIGVARDLVYNEKYRLAVLVPVIRKQDILYFIARKRPEYQLPAKLTCFLPKPAGALLMVQIEDLRKDAL